MISPTVIVMIGSAINDVEGGIAAAIDDDVLPLGPDGGQPEGAL